MKAFNAFALSLSVVTLIVLAPKAEAKTFRNAYVSFELGDRWACTLEQTEWVCRTTDPGLAEAVIILTAKEVGPQDALMGYESHLKTPRTIMTRTGQTLQSTVYRVEQRNINGHPWIFGMHFGSEVPNYYTSYVATTKDRIAVLVTLSAHKLFYTKYSAEFFRVIQSLRVIATRSLMDPKSGAGGADLPGSNLLGGQTSSDLMPAEPGALDGDGGDGGGGGASKGLMAIALIVGAAGVYMFLKKKKKKKKSR